MLEPPFRVFYPVAPAVTGNEESVVSAGVQRAPEELAAYRARFFDAKDLPLPVTVVKLG